MSLIEKALRKTREMGGKPLAHQAPIAPASTPERAGSAGPASLARGTPGRRLKLDTDWLQTRGMIPPEDAQRRHISQIRVIKNRLLRAAQASSSASDRVIMVTSALSGDGKTFSSISIALSLATERDYHVLLVDGDVPKPNVGQLFGIDSEPGLLDAARDPGLDVEHMIIGTDLPGLDLLSAGHGGVDAAEVMSSTGMREVLERLTAVPNRIVLLDSPPLLQTSEAVVLAHFAGQVLLVVREAVTPQRAVEESLAMLGERGGVSLVLNGATESRLEHYYYGYDQGYGYGQLDSESERTREVAGA
jgi:Mrp family chromosome partitioning ATPase